MTRITTLALTFWATLLLIGGAEAEVKRTSGLLSEKTKWETPYFIIDSGVAGPKLLITGGVHGNEPAGFRAAEQIRHWTPARGRLIVVPRVNVPGIEQKTRGLPGEDEATRNANRNFPQSGGPNEVRSAPVKALWKFIGEQQPDWVADLHEGFDFHVANPKSSGSSIIYFDTPEMQKLAAKIHEDVNAAIDDPQREIVKTFTTGPIDGGLVRGVIERFGAKGFCFETTYEKQPVSLRARQQRIMVHRLMRELKMAPGDVNVMTAARPPAKAASPMRVAVFDAGGTGGKGVLNLERILEAQPAAILHHVGPPDIQCGVLEQFDAVIFPGGSGKKEAAALGEKGKQAVKKFVESGGGYVGICAGAFLATAKYDWSLALMDAQTFTGNREIPGVGTKSMWFRGTGKVKLELTKEGRAILGDRPGLVELGYANGPILSPLGREDLPKYIPLAYFRTEISLWEPQKGTMIDTPAITANEFGKGRVIAISPHPEGTPGLESLVRRAVAWAAGKSGQPAPE